MTTVLLIREIDGQNTVVAEYDVDAADKIAIPSDGQIIQRTMIDRLYAATGLSEPQLLAMLGLVDARETPA